MTTEAIVAIIATSVTAFFVALRAVVKWGLEQWAASAADSREVQRQTITALVANTGSNATLIVKVDELSRKIDFVTDFVHESTPVNQPVPRRTPASGVPVTPGGYSLGRGRTQGDR